MTKGSWGESYVHEREAIERGMRVKDAVRQGKETWADAYRAAQFGGYENEQ